MQNSTHEFINIDNSDSDDIIDLTGLNENRYRIIAYDVGVSTFTWIVLSTNTNKDIDSLEIEEWETHDIIAENLQDIIKHNKQYQSNTPVHIDVSLFCLLCTLQPSIQRLTKSKNIDKIIVELQPNKRNQIDFHNFSNLKMQVLSYAILCAYYFQYNNDGVKSTENRNPTPYFPPIIYQNADNILMSLNKQVYSLYIQQQYSQHIHKKQKISLEDSKPKTNIDDTKGKRDLEYRLKKKQSIVRGVQILEGLSHLDKHWLEFLLQHDKMDDLTDALLHGIFFLFIKGAKKKDPSRSRILDLINNKSINTTIWKKKNTDKKYKQLFFSVEHQI